MKKNDPEPLLWFLQEEMSEAVKESLSKFENDSLNNFGRLWSIGVVSSCPVPGPGVI